MSRLSRMAASAAVLTAAALAPAPSAPLVAATNADVTGAYGPFGFTTMGLGETGNYGEPSLAVAPDGRHVIASTPGGGGVDYWFSADNGKTWGTTHTNGGGGDSALDFLPDGTALSADLHVQDSLVGVSHDFGKTWGPNTAAGIEQDRQWLTHTDDASRLLMVYHDFVAEGEFIAESDDGGVTWTHSPQDQIVVNQVNQGSALPILAGGHSGNVASLVDQGANTFSGPLVIADADWYVFYSISDAQSNVNPTQGVPPYGPTRAVVVAHSSDGGKTWTNVLADVPDGAGTTNESSEGAIFPWGFVDQQGNVYAVFDSTRGASGDSFHQYYVYSKDKGMTWSAPIKIDKLPVGTGATVYATGAAGLPGVIDVAWYQSDSSTPSQSNGTWVPHVAQVTHADSANPEITESAVTTIPNHVGGICLQGILCGVGPGSSDRSLLDFFQLKINPASGMMEIAYADNNRLGNGKGEVVFAQQTAGKASVHPRPGYGQTGAGSGSNASGGTVPLQSAPTPLPTTAPARASLALLVAVTLLLASLAVRGLSRRRV